MKFYLATDMETISGDLQTRLLCNDGHFRAHFQYRALPEDMAPIEFETVDDALASAETRWPGVEFVRRVPKHVSVFDDYGPLGHLYLDGELVGTIEFDS